MHAKSLVLTIIALGCGIVSSVAVRNAMESQPTHRRRPRVNNENASDARSNSIEQVEQRNANRNWPPAVGQRFPDITLRDTTGIPVRLSRYEGKVLLIEPIGVACKACQAFSGGHDVGGLFGHRPQPGLRSIHEYVEHYGKGVNLNGKEIVSIHVLFYGNDGKTAPTLKEAQQWADHFGKYSRRTVVLYADQSFVNSQTRAMIPGFLLIDRDFVLRSAAGNPPKADLHRELIPMIKELL